MDKGTIICVDDEKVVLKGIHSQLSREFSSEYAIEVAESGEEAFELITELLSEGKDIPVVISDELMPNMKGHELLIKINEVSQLTYKILLTGHSDLESVTKAVNQANLYRYIVKPWESQDLILTVKEAIKGYQQDKQLKELKNLLEIHSHLFALIK